MNTTLKKILIIVATLIAVLFVAYQFMKYKTKQISPETSIEYKNGANIIVNYSQPAKKGREIFGKLVPYGKVWRTGANEATTFDTDKNLIIGGNTLPAGHYTLWTIPNADNWEVIFNKKDYNWGVNFDGTTVKDNENDVLKVNVPVAINETVVEQFNISFIDTPTSALVLAWDKTKVMVPFQK